MVILRYVGPCICYFLFSANIYSLRRYYILKEYVFIASPSAEILPFHLIMRFGFLSCSFGLNSRLLTFRLITRFELFFRFFWAELEASGGTLFFAASKEVIFAAGGRLPTSRNKGIKTSPTLCTMFLWCICVFHMFSVRALLNAYDAHY